MINYSIISDSIEYYEKFGFSRIETPWLVSDKIENITRPQGAISFEVKHNGKCLVASGEQSFLYQYVKGFLPKGQYQTVTPCFRYEEFDFLHSKYFIKNELIKTDIVNEEELDKIVEIALNFYQKYIPEAYVKKTSIGYDIEIGGYELGSYGIRNCEFLKWIYATGVAEPRLSKLITWLTINRK